MILYEIKKGKDINNTLQSIDVDLYAIEKFIDKADSLNIFIKDLKTSHANIIKQELLSLGADAAISKNSYNCSKETTDVLLIANRNILTKFIEKLKAQPACFNELVYELNNFLSKNNKIFKIKNKVFDLNKDFLVMGILNITPDSFSDGGKYTNIDDQLRRIEYLVANKIDILDIGGVSSRPNASFVSTDEEIERLIPVIKAVKKNFDVLISIDSYNTSFIKEAINYNIDIVNDISSGKAVFNIVDLIINKNISLILMNNNSKDLNGSSPLDNDFNVIDNFIDFRNKTIKTLNAFNFDISKLCFDPGIGFGLSTKSINNLFKNISSINDYSLLIGLSRKSYFTNILKNSNIDKDLVSNACSLFLMHEKIKFFRTHDPEGLNTMINLYKELA